MAQINISGENGRHGLDGNNGSLYGQEGGNAFLSEAGGPGGKAYLRLSRVKDVPS